MDTVFLKTHKDALIPVICKIINWSISTGVFPASKTAVITPSYKAGNRLDVSNYRSISIIPAMSKVIETFISEQITSH